MNTPVFIPEKYWHDSVAFEAGVPWLTPECVFWLDGWIASRNGNVDVLEFGAGGSTVYFGTHCKRTWSYETNPQWAQRVQERLRNNMQVAVRHMSFDEIKRDIESLSPVDIVLVDSDPKATDRPSLFLQAMRLVKPGGLLILDNYSVFQQGLEDVTWLKMDFHDSHWMGAGTRVYCAPVKPPKIAAVCCTYKRPKQLGHMIYCYERQTVPEDQRELVILDDAGQYESRTGNWRLISQQNRYPSLGEKRNAVIDLVGSDVEYMAVWDDDDLYAPWALEAVRMGLQVSGWVRLKTLYTGTTLQTLEKPGYHAAWGYRRSVFEQAGRYPKESVGEDALFGAAMCKLGIVPCNPVDLGFKPYYACTQQLPDNKDWHLCGRGYESLADLPCEPATIEVAPHPVYRSLFS